MDSKVLKKTVHHPYGATSDALQRVYLGSRAGFGIVAELYRCDPPPGGGAIEFLESRILGFCAYFWAKMPFFGKKRQKKIRPKNSPKMAQKWSKMAKIAPKSAK